MSELGVPEKRIRLIKMTMKVTSAAKIQNEISEPFDTFRGLRQGDALASQLFNLAIEKMQIYKTEEASLTSPYLACGHCLQGQ